jgi:hypothetical protein
VPLYRNPPGSIVDGSSTRLPSASSPRTTTLDGVQPVGGGSSKANLIFGDPLSIAVSWSVSAASFDLSASTSSSSSEISAAFSCALLCLTYSLVKLWERAIFQLPAFPWSAVVWAVSW